MAEVLPIWRKTLFNHSINQSTSGETAFCVRAKGFVILKQYTKFYFIIWDFPSVLFHSLSLTTSTSLSNCDFDSIARNVISKYTKAKCISAKEKVSVQILSGRILISITIFT